MSANNQVLVQEYKGKWYVFDNVQAESWSEENELSIKSAKGVFDGQLEAIEFAAKLDSEIDDFAMENSEYGVVLNELYKDSAKVTLVE